MQSTVARRWVKKCGRRFALDESRDLELGRCGVLGEVDQAVVVRKYWLPARGRVACDPLLRDVWTTVR
jgi:hypothetical protein